MTTIEKIRAEICEAIDDNDSVYYTSELHKALDIIDKYAEQEPCDDVVSRQAVIDALYDLFDVKNDRLVQIPWYASAIDVRINALPSVQPKTWQFAEWVAREIFDDMWEYNKDAFAELACRKLAKLGIVKESGDVWELVESQESEDKE